MTELARRSVTACRWFYLHVMLTWQPRNIIHGWRPNQMLIGMSVGWWLCMCRYLIIIIIIYLLVIISNASALVCCVFSLSCCVLVGAPDLSLEMTGWLGVSLAVWDFSGNMEGTVALPFTPPGKWAEQLRCVVFGVKSLYQVFVAVRPTANIHAFRSLGFSGNLWQECVAEVLKHPGTQQVIIPEKENKMKLNSHR